MTYLTSTPESGVRELPTLAEIRTLVAGTRHPLHRAIIVLSSKTGIDVGELCNPNRVDVYIGPDAPDEFHATPPVASRQHALRIRPSKESPHSIRRERTGESLVPLDGELQETLIRWLAVVPDSVDSPRPSFLSTADNWGSRLTPDIVHHVVEANAHSLGLHEEGNELGNLTPYAFRCFFDVSRDEFVITRAMPIPSREAHRPRCNRVPQYIIRFIDYYPNIRTKYSIRYFIDIV